MKTEQEIRKQAIEECVEILKDYEGEGMTKVIHKLESLLSPSPAVSDEEIKDLVEGMEFNFKEFPEIEQFKWSRERGKICLIAMKELLSLRTAKAEPYQFKVGDEIEIMGFEPIKRNYPEHFKAPITIEEIVTKKFGEETGYLLSNGYTLTKASLTLVKSAEPEKAEPEINQASVIRLAEELGWTHNFSNQWAKKDDVSLFISPEKFGGVGSYAWQKPYSEWNWTQIKSLLSPAPSLVDKIKARIELNLKDPSETEYEKGWDDGQKQILSMIKEAQNGN